MPSISVITSYEPFSVGVRSQLTAVAALVAVQLPTSVTELLRSLLLFLDGELRARGVTVVAQLEAHGMVTLGEQREITPAVSRRILEAAL